MRNPFRRRVSRPPQPRRVASASEIVAAAQAQTPDARARALLLAHLNRDQRATYTKANYIQLAGSEGGSYCLHAEPAVYRINERGDHVIAYCSYVPDPDSYDWDHFYALGHYRSERLPRDDEVLAHLLLLQHDENRFLAIAPAFVAGALRAHR